MDLSKHNPDPHNVQYLLSILRGDDEQSSSPHPPSQSDLPLSDAYSPSEQRYGGTVSNSFGQLGSRSHTGSGSGNFGFAYNPDSQAAPSSSLAAPSVPSKYPHHYQASLDPRPRTTPPFSARSSSVEHASRTQQLKPKCNDSVTPPAQNTQASGSHATLPSVRRSEKDSPPDGGCQGLSPPLNSNSNPLPPPKASSLSAPNRKPSQQLTSLPAALPTLRTLSKSPKFLRLLMNLKRQQDTLEKSLKYEHGELVAAKASPADMSKWKAEALERWDEQMEIQQAQLGDAGLPNFWKTKSKVVREAQREVLDVLGGMVGK